MSEELTQREREVRDMIAMYSPIERETIAEEFDITGQTVSGYVRTLRERGIVETRDGQYHYCGEEDTVSDGLSVPGLDAVERDGDPDPNALTEREEYLARELQTGIDPSDMAAELDTRESVIHQHLRDLKRNGWRVYVDESAGQVAIEGDHTLRSSEHKGTRTREANQWWELRHNALVREFKSLAQPDTDLSATSGREDWVLHMTDLHAGDRVRTDDGTVVYSTDDIPDVVDYITQRALALADTHGREFDTGHLLWGGDFLTNEGIYEGQFEDLDAWLDEQHDAVIAPLLRQLKAFARRFETVNVIGQVGNHGQHRASGTSRQANADLVLYKTIRNVVAELRKEVDVLDNVRFRIGSAKAYRNFPLRGGRLTGHLRHGQHRRPQAETSARKKEWLSTLREHEFELAWLGHHHISGRIPWDGPPILCSGSPKPSGEFVERIGESVAGGQQDMATVCGVSDDGITAVFPIDSRGFGRVTGSAEQ